MVVFHSFISDQISPYEKSMVNGSTNVGYHLMETWDSLSEGLLLHLLQLAEETFTGLGTSTPLENKI